MAAALWGCATPVQRPPNLACDFTPYLTAERSGAVVGPLQNTLTPVPLNTVRIIDPRIANKILPQSVDARRTPTGTVEVRARLVNCTDFPQQIQARTLFLDSAKFDVEPPSVWRRVIIPPRSFGQYAEKSMSAERVANFTIEMREGD
jgi:hypothetical protein